MKQTCKNCRGVFEAKRSTAEFCSANCRVKWNNASKNPDGIPFAPKQKVYDAPPVKNLKDEPLKFQGPKDPLAANDALIGKGVREYCERNKTTVDDFIAWSMENYISIPKPKKMSFNKKVKEQVQENLSTEKDESGLTRSQLEIRRSKLGF